MADADTSVVQKEETSSQEQTDTSAKKAEEVVVTDTSIKEEDSSKAEVDRLQNELARSLAIQRDAQKREALKEKENRRLQSVLRGKGIDAENASTTEESSQDDSAHKIALTQEKAKRMIAETIAYNSNYWELVNKDETLRHILKTNPLSLVNEYYDAEDAVIQIEDFLAKRISLTKNSVIGKKNEEGKVEGKKFDIAPVNTTSTTVSKKDELMKAGKFDEALEESIASRLKFSG